MSDPSPSTRIPCRTPACPNAIQPATAARNDGLCGPCAGKRDRAARDAFVRANRRDVDRFAGVTDPVELLLLMHQPRRPDPLVNLLPPPRAMEEVYASLSPTEVAGLIEAVDAQDLDVVESVARCLAAFSKLPLDALQNALLDRGTARPAIAFRDATAGVRDRLIGALDRPAIGTSLRRLISQPGAVLGADHTLSALAQIGDDAVVAYFESSDRRRPMWSRSLHIAPSAYATTAGWELVDGRRRELAFGDACVGLHAVDAGVASPVRVHGPRDEACPWCGGALVNLVELDLTAPALRPFALSIGVRVDVATCPVCTCFGEVHATLDAGGRSTWSAANVRPSYLPPDGGGWARSKWADSGVRLAPRGRLHGADEFLPTTFSQIGGLPGWVQDPTYPRCHACAQTMTFLAQIDESAFPYNEGIYYAFVCPTCRTTATTYQQT